MSTLMKMENVKVVEDTSQLISSEIVHINEKYLWCEPLTNDKDVAEARRHLLLTKVPFVHAKFDTTITGNDGIQMYRRVDGLFVRQKDLWETYSRSGEGND